jgi:hypothetical protein
VPHLQLVNALAPKLGPSLLVCDWLARTARTSSPPHFEHSRFCIARPDTEKPWQLAEKLDLALAFGWRSASALR